MMFGACLKTEEENAHTDYYFEETHRQDKLWDFGVCLQTNPYEATEIYHNKWGGLSSNNGS